ncbi:alkaline phosphatase [Amycolatopsis albispora]|uniref:Alkaline phosphatase n=2 Tax=Amycolatopsis albispora TaxID=1804986 RepID=A0A344LJZ9_9PSEU|nr:BREX-2 system phosphatase PglZ [Amycolatopsis albispora]AXB48373.1 alkaline phosphatase [Amycolatopsis albispora]
MIETLLAGWLPQAKEHRLVLIYGRYEDGSSDFVLSTEQDHKRVYITDQHSVLGIVEAWQQHQTERGADDVLVVTTSVDDAQLGWDIRGYALGRSTRTADRASIVAQRFGAADLDPRVRAEPWLIDALLDAEPAGGWPRSGSVLTRDTAMRSLIGARLGIGTLREDALDAGALLAWSLDPTGPNRFARFPAAEQAGMTDWLAGSVGEVAPIVLRLAAAGKAADAMPLGLVGTVATRPDASPEAALAFGGLLAGVRPPALRAFTDAVEGTLERWLSEAESGGRLARERITDVANRADQLAASAHLTEALRDSRFLPSSYAAALGTLAGALSPTPVKSSITAVERALDEARDHGLARLEPERLKTAEMAVRVHRWLALPLPDVGSAALAANRQVMDWAWVDRALTTLWVGDTGGDPAVAQAYRALHQAARNRRDRLDEQFAAQLASWVPRASGTNPGGCLLIEDVLDTVVRPVASRRTPLVIVLDGMTTAIGAAIGEETAAGGWREASPRQGERVAAVTVFPSVTRAGRASLLSGVPSVGDQSVERAGFAAFWRKHRREAALFHKNDLAGEAGQRLSERLLTALAGDGVVGVVLNTIDDALDHGKEGERAGWSTRDITYLPELLDAARGYGRPVVLVADHGHVLERSSTEKPSKAEGTSARWRTGPAGDDEIELAGPRVLLGGRVTVPWREDIRYTSRKSGYHGGASLAEMIVPVLVLLPSDELVPAGWHILSPEAVTPAWWEPRRTVLPEQPAPARKPGRRKPEPEPAVPLFAVEAPDESVGTRVVATDLYAAQRAFVPKAPDKQVVAAVIDALLEADGSLSLSAVAERAGRAARRPEFFVRTLERLVNVDGYPVLTLRDGDRSVKLDREMLQTQFGVRVR